MLITSNSASHEFYILTAVIAYVAESLEDGQFGFYLLRHYAAINNRHQRQGPAVSGQLIFFFWHRYFHSTPYLMGTEKGPTFFFIS